MTCPLIHGICALCHGRDLAVASWWRSARRWASSPRSRRRAGHAVDACTFHTGGVAAGAGGDITSGLPRVEELFEARKKPKGEAVVDISGTLRLERREGTVLRG